MKDMEKQQSATRQNEQLFVVFSLAGEDFAAPVSQVKEVIKPPSIVKIPESENFIEGMINIRGKVIPVVNLKKRLRLHDKEYNDKARVMIVDVAANTTGLIVDNVSEVVRVNMDTIQKAPQASTKIGQKYIQGVVLIKKAMVILLDLDKIFAVEETSLLCLPSGN